MAAVGILASARCRRARLVADAVTAAGGTTVALDLDMFHRPEASIGPDLLHWQGHDLRRLAGLWVFGYRYESPAIPAAEPDVDWSLWQAGHVVDQQRHSFLYSLLARAEAAGVRVDTPLATRVEAFMPAALLARCRAAGLATPDWVCTNEAAEMDRILAAGPAVWRPVTGRAAWQRFTARQRDALGQPHLPPLLVAPVVPGALLRVFVLDGTVILTLAQAAPEGEPLEAFEGVWAVPSSEAAGAQAAAQAACQAVGFGWAMVLVAQAEDGTATVVDLDPDPVFTDLPPAFAAEIATALGRFGATGAATAVPVPAPARRDVLFLRRMLRVQFDMEATKYAADG